MYPSRRKFLLDATTAVAGSWLLSSGRIFDRGYAASSGQGFVLSMHAGSWDGWASGLLQPNELERFPSGVFRSGVRIAAQNPFLNDHRAADGHIFHHYNQFLTDVSSNLLHVTCQPGSLDHNVARIIQKSGSSVLGAPHWALGAGQMLMDRSAGSLPFIVTDSMECMASGYAPDAVGVLASDVAGMRRAIGQPASLGANPPASGHAKLLEAIKGGFEAPGRASVLPDSVRATFESTIQTAYMGVPALDEADPRVVAARAAINVTELDASIRRRLGDNPETTAILADAGLKNAVVSKLQLAAILATTGVSPGMAMALPAEDRHAGGSQIQTARVSAVMWAGLTLFWSHIKAAGMQSKCLVIVTHEFSRTPWNRNFLPYTMTHNGKSLQVDFHGTDHHPVNGVYLLSGKFSRGGRLGGVQDGYAAGGGADFGTGPSSSIAAPTTLAAVGSALMAVFPDQFRHPGQRDSGRVVRSLWPGFADEQILQAIRDI
jgi:hypothetical protein